MAPRLRFGEYVLEADSPLLGPGGVTETYRARGADGSPCALKVLRADRLNDATAQGPARFLAAARRMQVSRAPALVPVRAMGERPAAYLVTELVEGANLAQVAGHGGGLEPAMALRLASSIARALADAHEERPPLLHLGLSPGNVIVTSDGQVKLLDFGIAAGLRGLGEMPEDRNVYLAPEILAGEPVGPAADLFAVGALLHLLLTGKPPASPGPPQQVLRQHLAGPPSIPGLSPHASARLRTLLEPDAAVRPSSAREVAAWLAAPAAVRKASAAAPEKVPRTEPKPKREPLPDLPPDPIALEKRRRLWVLVGAGLLSAALVGGAVMVRKSAQQPVGQELPDEPAPTGARPVPTPPPSQPRVPGQFALETDPPGASIWVDGVHRGRTPVALQIGAGAHRVFAVLAGHRTWRDTVDTTTGESLRRRLVPVQPPRGPARLRVECRTQGQWPILINDQETGLVCPVREVPAPPGKISIGIYLPGERRTQAVERTLENGKLTVVRFDR